MNRRGFLAALAGVLAAPAAALAAKPKEPTLVDLIAKGSPDPFATGEWEWYLVPYHHVPVDRSTYFGLERETHPPVKLRPGCEFRLVKR